MDLEIATNTARCAWGGAGPVSIVLWRDITAADLNAFSAYAVERATRFAAYGVVSFTGASLRPPPADVREAIIKLTTTAIGPNYKGSTTVVLGQGFVASVVRAALAGLSLAGGKGMPDHVSRDAEEAARYLAPRVDVDVAALGTVLRAFLDATALPGR